MKRSILLAALLPGLFALAACGDDPATLLTRARSELSAGDDKAARINLLAALKARPDDAVLLNLLARTQLRLGDGEAALATLDRLARTGAQGPALARLRAEAELKRGRPDAALVLLGQDPDPDAWRLRAAAQRARGDDAAALDAFAAGLKAGGNRDLAIDYARLLMDGQDLAGAGEMLARARALGGDGFDVQLLAGDLHARQSQPQAAAARYRAAAAMAPRRIEPLLGQAQLADAAGRINEVEQLVGQARAIAPDDPRVARWTIQLAQLKGDWETVRAALGPREDSIEPASADGFAYAEALLRLGQPEQARALFSRALSVSPQNPYARLMLAEAQLATGDARSAFQTVLPLAQASDAPDEALDLAERAARAARLPETAAIAARRASPELAANRRLSATGLAAYAAGDWNAATRAFAALNARGEDAEVLRLYELSASHAGQHDAAVQAADHALALRPGNPDMLYTAGVARLNAKREPPRAVQLLQAALAADPRNLIYRTALARARSSAQP